MRNIRQLPTVRERDVRKIDEFYEKFFGLVKGDMRPRCLGRVRRTNMLSDYDAVIREQLVEGVVEKATSHTGQ